MDALNIVFAGTPDFAAGHLQALIDSRHNVVGVYSQPDRPAGRGKKLQPSPVKQLALEHNIPVFQPLNFKQEGAIAELESLNADIMIVVAYGLLLPLAVLEAPKMGCLNVHASIYLAGGVPHRFNGRFKPGIPKPESPSCKWMLGWILAIC